jgi:hypothetical protein
VKHLPSAAAASEALSMAKFYAHSHRFEPDEKLAIDLGLEELADELFFLRAVEAPPVGGVQ